MAVVRIALLPRVLLRVGEQRPHAPGIGEGAGREGAVAELQRGDQLARLVAAVDGANPLRTIGF